MLPTLVRAGLVLANKYRLLDCLGKGGMGQVWRARDSVLGANVAVKVIDPELLETDDSRQEIFARFLREAQAAAALRSPHVVQILEFGIDEVRFDPTRPKLRVPFIAMELLEGETLADRLAQSGILPYKDTARILAHIGRAMTKAHELGIVHRDLKPSNVFLTRNDDEELAKVMDFGIAKRLPGALSDDGADVTRTGRIMGTPAYMSPEQTVGTKPLDARSDLWSMAVIAFECVCGRRPFEGVTHGELTLQICAHEMPVPSRVTQVPPGFDAWFARAAARDPDRRFPTARELAEALRAVLSQPGLSEPTPPSRAAAAPSDTQPGLTTTRVIPHGRGRTTMFLTALALGIIAGGSVLAALAWQAKSPPAAASGGPERPTGRERTTPRPAARPPGATAEATARPASTGAPDAQGGGPASADTGREHPDASATATDARARPAARPPGGSPSASPHAPRTPAGRSDGDGPGKDPRLGF